MTCFDDPYKFITGDVFMDSIMSNNMTNAVDSLRKVADIMHDKDEEIRDKNQKRK